MMEIDVLDVRGAIFRDNLFRDLDIFMSKTIALLLMLVGFDCLPIKDTELDR